METLDPEVRSDVELAAQIWARRRRGQDQRWVASCLSSMLSATCGIHQEVAAHLAEAPQAAGWPCLQACA